MSNGLQDFLAAVGDYGKVLSAAFGSAAILLITNLVQIAPPWPNAIVQVSAIAQLAILMLLFQRSKKSQKKSSDRLLKMSVFVSALLLFVYLILFSLLVHEVHDDLTIIRGLECTKDVELTYGEDCPLLYENFAKMGSDPDVAWTLFGLTLSRILVLASWLGFIATATMAIAAFTFFQRLVPGSSD